MKKLQGAITAIVTPFTKTGAVDTLALKKLVQFQLTSGISGIVPCGSTGEAMTLNLKEYALVIETVVGEVKKKVPVIAGAGNNDTIKAIEFSKIAKKAGADMLLHVSPYYNKPTPSGLLAHYKAIADAVNLPIILYNVPGRTGSNVTASTVLDIAKKVTQIVGVKEASGNLGQMMEIVKGAPSYFSVLSGDDVLTLPLISVGGDGCISVVANEVPKEFSDMVRFALNGDFEQAKKLHYQLLDLMNVNFVESNPIPVKAALAIIGKIKEVYRLPLTKISDKNKEVVANVLREGGFIK